MIGALQATFTLSRTRSVGLRNLVALAAPIVSALVPIAIVRLLLGIRSIGISLARPIIGTQYLTTWDRPEWNGTLRIATKWFP